MWYSFGCKPAWSFRHFKIGNSEIPVILSDRLWWKYAQLSIFESQIALIMCLKPIDESPINVRPVRKAQQFKASTNQSRVHIRVFGQFMFKNPIKSGFLTKREIDFQFVTDGSLSIFIREWDDSIFVENGSTQRQTLGSYFGMNLNRSNWIREVFIGSNRLMTLILESLVEINLLNNGRWFLLMNSKVNGAIVVARERVWI